MKNGSLTFDEMVQACKNVGIDLTCGACAAVFYTGVGVSTTHTCTEAQGCSLRSVAEEAAWELLHVDASMKDRAEVAEKVMRALGLPWPPPKPHHHEFSKDGDCVHCGLFVEDAVDDFETCE